MRALWFVNIGLPEACKILNMAHLPFGGWLVNTSKLLAETNGMELFIAFPHHATALTKLQGERITYYTFPKKDDALQKDAIKQIIDVVQPDIVHIFGTEFSHGKNVLECYPAEKSIVSIQGLLHICAKHFLSGVPIKSLFRLSVRDFLKGSILKQEKDFYRRGQREIEFIKKAKHVIGRTTWDYACVKQINPEIKYHHNNEILRESFYTSEDWDYNKCKRHTIFMSQASYPIKGFHYMLEALKIIVSKYPDTLLRIGGSNPIAKQKFGGIFLSSYGQYLLDLIKKYELVHNIEFLGMLDEDEMKKTLLDSNVFVLPSLIENSPNSLGEAMILSVPCVASNVGGVCDLLDHRKEGFLYPADEPYMLAHYIMEVFENKEFVREYTENAKVKARNTHSEEKNVAELLAIYKAVLEEV